MEFREDLLNLWNDIHYHRLMDKRQVTFLTSVQRFRCRKRHPPPAALCPYGMPCRNFPPSARQRLMEFAAQVTVHPTKEQRTHLALELRLQHNQVYNWFANYRRRQWPKILGRSADHQAACRAAPLGPAGPPSVGSASSSGPSARLRVVFQEALCSESEKKGMVTSDPSWGHTILDLDCLHIATVPTPPDRLWCIDGWRSRSLAGSMCLPEIEVTNADCHPSPSWRCFHCDTSRNLDNICRCSHWTPVEPSHHCNSPWWCRGLGVTPDTARTWFEDQQQRIWEETSSGAARCGSADGSTDSKSQLSEHETGSCQTGSYLLPSSSLPADEQFQSLPVPALTEEDQPLEHTEEHQDLLGDTFWGAWLLFEFSGGSRV
ncbi:anomalous homeobox protein [Lissotriton helveticus]